MRLAFAGTPEFAAEALRQLIGAGHSVALVLSQPDRPAGRGMKLQPSPVKMLALQHGLTVAQPRGLRLDGRHADDARAAQAALAAAAPEVLVVAAYGLILPQWALDRPERGCINIHASLLPRWRGAAPIHRAIEAGDRSTGISLMRMDAGLDTGDILLAAAEQIRADDTTGTLHDRLAALGGRLCVQGLAMPALPATPQPADGVCYASKVDKSEAAIDWAQPAAAVERRLRAFDPFPGAHFTLDGEAVKLWRATVRPELAGEPGQVLRADAGGLVVACGDGALELLQLQRPGGRRIAAAAFVQQHAALVGRRLGIAA